MCARASEMIRKNEKNVESGIVGGMKKVDETKRLSSFAWDGLKILSQRLKIGKDEKNE